MSVPRPIVGAAAPVSAYPPVAAKWTAKKELRPRPQPKVVPYTRRYEIRWIDEDGQVEDMIRIAPALSEFEAGFSAFTHGALVTTDQGPVAVEDLDPGMQIATASGGYATLRWIGAMTLIPGAPHDGGQPAKLYRVVADGLGLGRPASDVTLGPAARLLDRSPETCRDLGSEAALAPVRAMADYETVIEITPVAPVRVYHLSFDGHHVIEVNGIEMESFHPGPDTAVNLSEEMRAQFLALFPHKSRLQDFGRMLWPRFDAGEV